MCFEMCLLNKVFTIGSSPERQLVTGKGDGFISLSTLSDQIECGSLELSLFFVSLVWMLDACRCTFQISG